MTRIAYVGLKLDGERAFKEKTNIEWFPNMIKDVDAKVAADMLRHTDVFALADADATLSDAAPSPAAKPVTNAPTGLPAWAKDGIAAGLTDEQLQSLAEAGGPDTEAGAKLWLDLVGKAYRTEPPAPTSVMRMPDGIPRILDGMTREALHDLASELRVKVHPMSGIPKVTAALLEAYPLKK